MGCIYVLVLILEVTRSKRHTYKSDQVSSVIRKEVIKNCMFLDLDRTTFLSFWSERKELELEFNEKWKTQSNTISSW